MKTECWVYAKTPEDALDNANGKDGYGSRIKPCG
jgi:hypothetical protein